MPPSPHQYRRNRVRGLPPDVTAYMGVDLLYDDEDNPPEPGSCWKLLAAGGIGLLAVTVLGMVAKGLSLIGK